VPPRKNTKLWKPDTPGARARNEAGRFSNYLGSALCLSTREFDQQVAEIQIRAAILNGFTAVGIPRGSPAEGRFVQQTPTGEK